jgi:hypothetical protein
MANLANAKVALVIGAGDATGGASRAKASSLASRAGARTSCNR